MRNERLFRVNIYAVGVVILFLVASVVAAVVMIVAGEMNTAVQSAVIYGVAFGLPSLVYLIHVHVKTKEPLSEILGFKRLPLKSLLVCVALGFLIQPLMSFISTLSSLVFENITDASMEEMAKMPLPALLLTIGLLPAVFEELICRGMLLHGYKDTPLWYALLVPALFFGLLHMNLQQITYAFAAGIYMALLVKITGSIWSSMIVHFLVNGTQSLLVYLSIQPEMAGSALAAVESMDPLSALVGVSIVSGICLPFFIWLTYLLMKWHGFREKTRMQAAKLPPHWHNGSLAMYIVMGILLLMAISTELMMPQVNALLGG